MTQHVFEPRFKSVTIYVHLESEGMDWSRALGFGSRSNPMSTLLCTLGHFTALEYGFAKWSQARQEPRFGRRRVLRTPSPCDAESGALQGMVLGCVRKQHKRRSAHHCMPRLYKRLSADLQGGFGFRLSDWHADSTFKFNATSCLACLIGCGFRICRLVPTMPVSRQTSQLDI